MSNSVKSEDETSDVEKQRVSYILVGEEGNECDAIELPVDDSGLMHLSTLQAQFPGATCLKFKHAETGRFRGIKLADSYLYPPENGWKTEDVYVVTFPKDHKRKAEEEICTTATGKPKKLEKKCVDLLVQSIPYHLDNHSLKSYFEKYGDVVFCDIKRDSNGCSRGFAFIRFSDYEIQEKVLVLRHVIDGRWCDVKIPNSQLTDPLNGETDSANGRQSSHAQGGGYDRRIFVGRMNREISDEILRSYFSKYGEVLDVYVPHPFRRWAFVTFKDPEIARSLIGRNMIIEDQSVQISHATPPKSKQSQQHTNANSSALRNSEESELNPGVSRPKRGYTASPMTYTYSNDNSWDGYPDSCHCSDDPGYSNSKFSPQDCRDHLCSGPPARRPNGPPGSQRRQPPHPPNSFNQPANQNPFLNPALLAQALTAVMSQWSQSSESSDSIGGPNHNHHHRHHMSKSSSSSSTSAYHFPPAQTSQSGNAYFPANAGNRSPFGGNSSSSCGNNHSGNGSNSGYQNF